MGLVIRRGPHRRPKEECKVDSAGIFLEVKQKHWAVFKTAKINVLSQNGIVPIGMFKF